MINLLLLCFSILLLGYTVFLLNILRGLYKLNPFENKNDELPSVTVIVPFRNEEGIILNCLKSIEKQNYPNEKLEVIFVDDNSSDNSFNQLTSAIKRKNFRVLKSPIFNGERGHKKRAVHFAIENSSSEIILTTDADCYHSENWITSMVSGFDEDTVFISGPVEFFDGETLFEKLQKLEFAGIIIAGAGLIGAGKPTICNAANLAFKRKVYFEVGGYNEHLNLSSGDDELFMQKIAAITDYWIKFNTDNESIVKTSPNKNLDSFYNQRKRWASKSLFYIDKFLIFQLIFIILFYLSFPLQLFLGFILNEIFFFSLVLCFLVKMQIEFLVLLKGKSKIFHNLDLSQLFLAEIFQIPYIIIAGLSGIFGNYKWKNRKVER